MIEVTKVGKMKFSGLQLVATYNTPLIVKFRDLVRANAPYFYNAYSIKVLAII